MPRIAPEKKPRRRSKGAAKGGAFEREIARRLSLWISEGKRDDIFWRSAMSGGRATIQASQGIVNQAQAGDLGMISPEGMHLLKHVVVECKAYKNLFIMASVFRGEGLLKRFWEKHYREARFVGREPFMVARENFVPTMLLTTPAAAKALSLDTYAKPKIHVMGWKLATFEPMPADGIFVYAFDEIVAPLPRKKKS